MRRFLIAILAAASLSSPVLAQDASRGFVIPVTVTGDLLVSDRAEDSDPAASPVSSGFRAVLYPSLKISSSWFVSSTIQVQSTPFFFYETYYPVKHFQYKTEQLYMGYSWKGEESAFGLKAGKLETAFGAFPLRYSDTANPLLDQPFAYAYPVKLRPDQLPCGVRDLAEQQSYPVYVEHYCGGATGTRSGMTPVTLYGLPGIEVNASWRRIDTRFQLTNSSPANPQSLSSANQHIQWTTGAGYTIRQGFRIGISGFKGPFLENDVTPYLDTDHTVDDYSAKGLGVDMKWGRGRWSANAEWDRVEFRYPAFDIQPALDTGSVEWKTILTPRFYAAFRAGYEDYSRVVDKGGNSADHFLSNRQSYEAALGYHLNHFQTLKVGYEWLVTSGQAGTRDNVFGVQFVTSLRTLSKAF